MNKLTFILILVCAIFGATTAFAQDNSPECQRQFKNSVQVCILDFKDAKKGCSGLKKADKKACVDNAINAKRDCFTVAKDMREFCPSEPIIMSQVLFEDREDEIDYRFENQRNGQIGSYESKGSYQQFLYQGEFDGLLDSNADWTVSLMEENGANSSLAFENLLLSDCTEDANQRSCRIHDLANNLIVIIFSNLVLNETIVTVDRQYSKIEYLSKTGIYSDYPDSEEGVRLDFWSNEFFYSITVSDGQSVYRDSNDYTLNPFLLEPSSGNYEWRCSRGACSEKTFISEGQNFIDQQ